MKIQKLLTISEITHFRNKIHVLLLIAVAFSQLIAIAIAAAWLITVIIAAAHRPLPLSHPDCLQSILSNF